VALEGAESITIAGGYLTLQIGMYIFGLPLAMGFLLSKTDMDQFSPAQLLLFWVYRMLRIPHFLLIKSIMKIITLIR